MNARTIKKYPNRRLYDTEESRYITLADVRNLVISKINFVVIDKSSGDT
jgi:polyhydroxyalkanoate synthesis repressor PhaR